jgi:hypothetical protein
MDLDNLPLKLAKDEDPVDRRRFVLQIVQPGLEGLMDGSVSNAGSGFCRALATQNIFHIHDTMLLVDPSGLTLRLESAGFRNAEIEIGAGRFRFVAQRSSRTPFP